MKILSKLARNYPNNFDALLLTRNKKMLAQNAKQNIKNIKLFSWEKGLLEIRPNRRKGCQLHLTENVLQDNPPP